WAGTGGTAAAASAAASTSVADRNVIEPLVARKPARSVRAASRMRAHYGPDERDSDKTGRSVRRGERRAFYFLNRPPSMSLAAPSPPGWLPCPPASSGPSRSDRPPPRPSWPHCPRPVHEREALRPRAAVTTDASIGSIFFSTSAPMPVSADTGDAT